jgi:hypothetical protein
MHAKSQTGYVDGTPIPAIIQILHFLKFGQFYIEFTVSANLEAPLDFRYIVISTGHQRSRNDYITSFYFPALLEIPKVLLSLK